MKRQNLQRVAFSFEQSYYHWPSYVAHLIVVGHSRLQMSVHMPKRRHCPIVEVRFFTMSDAGAESAALPLPFMPASNWLPINSSILRLSEFLSLTVTTRIA